MKNSMKILAVLILFLAFGCQKEPIPVQESSSSVPGQIKTSPISGKIINKMTGEPVANQRIDLQECKNNSLIDYLTGWDRSCSHHASAVSNENGKFEMKFEDGGDRRFSLYYDNDHFDTSDTLCFNGVSSGGSNSNFIVEMMPLRKLLEVKIKRPQDSIARLSLSLSETSSCVTDFSENYFYEYDLWEGIDTIIQFWVLPNDTLNINFDAVILKDGIRKFDAEIRGAVIGTTLNSPIRF